MASPILRETIKKLKDRRALLERQIKGPLAELRQIEEDLEALGAGSSPSRRRAAGPTRKPTRARREPRGPRAPRGATEAAVLRAIRNGATTAEEIAAKKGIAEAKVNRAVTVATTKSKRITSGPNGLTLTKAGREQLAQHAAATAE
jgi:hypothetical protein